MGIADKERRYVHVDESIWRKAKVLAAAFGVPIYAIMEQAITEMAENHKEQVTLMLLGEVKHEQVRDRKKGTVRRRT